MARGAASGGAGPIRRVMAAAGLAAALMFSPQAPASAAEPIKVGFSMAMTGSVAQNGKQLLIALELWRDDVNAKGGPLWRPVELVYYDDQSNPSNVPGNVAARGHRRAKRRRSSNGYGRAKRRRT